MTKHHATVFIVASREVHNVGPDGKDVRCLLGAPQQQYRPTATQQFMYVASLLITDVRAYSDSIFGAITKGHVLTVHVRKVALAT